MALHEIHWNPSARALVLVRNHEMSPDSGCGWVGEEVDDHVTPPVMTAIAERIMAALGGQHDRHR